VLSGAFIAEADGVGNITMDDVQTFLAAFLNMFLRSACFIDEALFW
jgi:hypothetical protein